MLLWVELALLLLCIVIGARLGGIGLGTISGLGLVVYVFVFRMPPGGPPGTVLGMIIAVITALATMQAAGGLDFLIGVAGRILAGVRAGHVPRAACHLRPGLRLGHPARRLRPPAGHRRGVAQGRHPARAAALGERDRGA